MTTKITDKNISNLANAGVQWQSVVVADGSTGLTAVAGRGYFINTTSGSQTVTLPASANVGDVIVLKDYARKWATNNVTLSSTTIDGGASSPTFSTNGQTVTLVYMDNTRGWSLINEDTTTNLGPLFVEATGGTITTSGNFKIHSFTGDGCFVVSQLGNPVGGPSTVDYLVVAGGGGGANDSCGPGSIGGGGGAGGYRTSFPSPGCNAGSFPISATTYPITVGGGGSGGTVGNSAPATKGSNSVFSTITSSGGATGRNVHTPAPNYSGGSGGGGTAGQVGSTAGGSGNTPPTSPSQGNNGGSGSPDAGGASAGGGGGAGAVGTNAVGPGNPTTAGGPGGAGSTNLITGSPVIYAGGGGGGANGIGGAGTGGPGGGAAGNTSAGATANTGGGGGGYGQPGAGGNGGKGIVVIRYKYQ